MHNEEPKYYAKSPSWSLVIADGVNRTSLTSGTRGVSKSQLWTANFFAFFFMGPPFFFSFSVIKKITDSTEFSKGRTAMASCLSALEKAKFGLVILTSRFEAIRRLFWDS
ncbi:hypothetical protein AVEN_74098-1 [Araneus ventricosus]|uniref:Uncharacterized protein n=1 Tax=Araneus ventricosus TaxID=182803 RepID=A0A4Y2J2T6_ARAVE|nr:hypothetical protein AVEN_74098-1 [Araneus ventricosus]